MSAPEVSQQLKMHYKRGKSLSSKLRKVQSHVKAVQAEVKASTNVIKQLCHLIGHIFSVEKCSQGHLGCKTDHNRFSYAVGRHQPKTPTNKSRHAQKININKKEKKQDDYRAVSDDKMNTKLRDAIKKKKLQNFTLGPKLH